MRKGYLAAAAISVPLVAIALREASKLMAGLSDPAKSSPGSILWIFAIFVALALLWTAAYAISRRVQAPSDRLPFAAAAAIAMREAKKRPPAEKCAVCGRPRISESASNCLYCGAAFTPSNGQSPSSLSC